MALGPNYRKLFAASTISNLGDGVGIIAYPWLASAVTRNPVLIATVSVVRFLPWLLFTLPAGVITDRFDRRVLMVGANTVRTVLTVFVALAVLWQGTGLPSPDDVAGEAVVPDDMLLYLIVVLASLLLGMAEVLYDNSAQTFVPRIVETPELEKANGRLYAAETIANQFLGPPLGSFLLAAGFAAPFFLDAGTFAASALLILLIVPGPPRQPVVAPPARQPWRQELREGFRWLWHHDLLRTLAIVLGLMNGLGNLALSAFVLFAQEVLDTTTTEFAILSMGGAIGGVVGGWTASSVSRRLGSGTALGVTLGAGAVIPLAIGLSSSWLVVFVLFTLEALTAVLWNVITVSLRQTIIPDHLLGRVNSVYRFFGWGMIPIGAAAGGVVVAIVDTFASREVALRAPWFVTATGGVLVFAYAKPRLTTAKIDAARHAVESQPTPAP